MVYPPLHNTDTAFFRRMANTQELRPNLDFLVESIRNGTAEAAFTTRSYITDDGTACCTMGTAIVHELRAADHASASRLIAQRFPCVYGLMPVRDLYLEMRRRLAVRDVPVLDKVGRPTMGPGGRMVMLYDFIVSLNDNLTLPEGVDPRLWIADLVEMARLSHVGLFATDESASGLYPSYVPVEIDRDTAHWLACAGRWAMKHFRHRPGLGVQVAFGEYPDGMGDALSSQAMMAYGLGVMGSDDLDHWQEIARLQTARVDGKTVGEWLDTFPKFVDAIVALEDRVRS